MTGFVDQSGNGHDLTWTDDTQVESCITSPNGGRAARNSDQSPYTNVLKQAAADGVVPSSGTVSGFMAFKVQGAAVSGVWFEAIQPSGAVCGIALGSNSAYNFGWTNTNLFLFHAGTNGASHNIGIATFAQYGDGNWHTVAWSFNASGADIVQFDGADVYNTSHINYPWTTSMLIAATGTRGTTNIVSDLIVDEMAWWNGSSLSSAQLTSLHTAWSNGTYLATVAALTPSAYWTMDDTCPVGSAVELPLFRYVPQIEQVFG